MRLDSQLTDPYTIDFIKLRTSTKTRPVAAAPTRGKDMTDYAPALREFEESVKAARKIIETNVLPFLDAGVNEYNAHLVRVGLDNVP